MVAIRKSLQAAGGAHEDEWQVATADRKTIAKIGAHVDEFQAVASIWRCFDLEIQITNT